MATREPNPSSTTALLRERAEQLREQAVEAREVALLIGKVEMRLRMLSVAQEWDLRAGELEQLAGLRESQGAALAFSFMSMVIPGWNSNLFEVRLDSPAGPRLGFVFEELGGWSASVRKADTLYIQWFADRNQAAAWLLSRELKLRQQLGPSTPE